MKIQFLYSDECPNTETAYSRLEEAVSELVSDTTIEKIKVATEEAAQKYNFYGSPSIHIDGMDLEYDSARQPSISCRLYGDEGVPPKWLIEASILNALKPKGLLFLCVNNSARSQIGEGIARKLAPAGVRVQSAGSKPTSVRPEAIAVLSELGIDASKQSSKNASQINPATVDTVITLCGEEECPLFPGEVHRVHWELPDPASPDAFRRVADELKKRLSIVFANNAEMKEADSIRSQVSSFYARSIQSSGGCCDGPKAGVLSEMAGYSENELSDIPDGAVSFGCGNPLAFSEVKEGQVVLDLGSGAGIDLIMAAKKVGSKGRVIGIDMTDEMIAKARKNIADSGLQNIEVRKGMIEKMPVESASIDWVISNCVINLSPEKDKVFAEIYRVLKPGGRISISDIVAAEMPDSVKQSMELYASCIAGAISEEEYLAELKQCGLRDVLVASRLVYDRNQLKSLVTSETSGGCSCSSENLTDELKNNIITALDGKVASLKFSALKPSSSIGTDLEPSCCCSDESKPASYKGRCCEQ